MFILPDCVSSGFFSYPDYRFYSVCEHVPGSVDNFDRKLYQCPTGLFYNPIYQGCTKSSFFSGHQVGKDSCFADAFGARAIVMDNVSGVTFNLLLIVT